MEMNKYIPLPLLKIEKIIGLITKIKTLENNKNSYLKLESISINKSD
jgi:hypothetical protein